MEEYNTKKLFPLKNGGGNLTPVDIKKKFDNMNVLLFTGYFILLVMVATLIIDSFHINSVTYTEYSKKLEVINETQDINKELLEQLNVYQEELYIFLQKENKDNLINK